MLRLPRPAIHSNVGGKCWAPLYEPLRLCLERQREITASLPRASWRSCDSRVYLRRRKVPSTTWTISQASMTAVGCCVWAYTAVNATIWLGTDAALSTAFRASSWTPSIAPARACASASSSSEGLISLYSAAASNAAWSASWAASPAMFGSSTPSSGVLAMIVFAG